MDMHLQALQKALTVFWNLRPSTAVLSPTTASRSLGGMVTRKMNGSSRGFKTGTFQQMHSGMPISHQGKLYRKEKPPWEVRAVKATSSLFLEGPPIVIKINTCCWPAYVVKLPTSCMAPTSHG